MIAAFLLSAASIVAGASGRLAMNHPMGAIPFAPPDAEQGQFLFAAALIGNQANNTQQIQGYGIDLDVPLLQETTIFQYVASQHIRFFAAATLGRSVDASAGLVVRIRQTGIVWETECSLGTSWRRLELDTLIASSSSRNGLYALRPDGRWGQWSQFALRMRTTGSGPWLEARALPAFPVGDAGYGHNDDQYYDDRQNSLALASFAAGWIVELSRKREGVLGIRQIALESGYDFQLLAQLHGSFSLR